ncbi:MAG: hypothetical protein EOO52_15120 [Gammaproteobacteria bacterium]|nr:MAG: hypothetical protein EOO52_15120 [Gammaproteobacteria bacterium]
MSEKSLRAKRSIGIKLWGFEKDPYEISKTLKVLCDPVAKGEPHGSKSSFKENQLYVLKLISEDESWDESLNNLVAALGGVDGILEMVKSIQPKNYFVVINIPTTDAWCGNGNHLSKATIETLHKLKTNVSLNYF